MRRVNDISEQENFRIEERSGFSVIKRDPVEPEPIGTIVLIPFRVTGYDPDCDGSLMVRLEALHEWDGKIDESGWTQNRIGLYPGTGLVVTEEELLALFGDDDDA